MMEKNKYENNIKTKYIAVIELVITDNENKFSNPNTAIKKAIIIDINNVLLIRFNGFDIL